VASRDHVEHVQHLREVLNLLKQHGLVINAEKCKFGEEKVEYLGHCITANCGWDQPIAEQAVDHQEDSPAEDSATVADLIGI
jgi:Reverse transcriptase (RNA-dependent DNA polymerase)